MDTRPMNIKRDDDTFTRIHAHYINPEQFPLSKKDQEIANRWYKAFSLRLNGRSKQEIITMWRENEGIEAAQTYRDIRNAESLFADVEKSGKEAMRAIWIHEVQDLKRRAKERGDRKTEGHCLDLLAKYAGFTHEDDKGFNPEKLLNQNIEFTLPDVYLKVLEDMISRGVVDFNNLNIVDIQYTPVENDEPDTE